MLFKLLVLACAVGAIRGQECGNPTFPPNEMSSFIVGGIPADDHSWPWMVSLLRPYSGGYYHSCGGTIISSEYIVSAAHCFDRNDKQNEGIVMSAGGINREILNEPTRQNRDILTITRHPEYRDVDYHHDIAVIKVEPPFELNDYVKPACLPVMDYAPGTTSFVTGWGAQEVADESDLLQQVDVPIVSQAACQLAYGSNIDETMICAGLAAGGKDSCQGDSGGPMVVKNSNNFWELVGVVSWGSGCADPNAYGVYADVLNLRPFIDEVTSM